jgi:leukotriene-A4 hydrolase
MRRHGNSRTRSRYSRPARIAPRSTSLQSAGRPEFDRLIREYIQRFRFLAVRSEEFVALVDELLPGVGQRVEARGNSPSDAQIAEWRPVEWLPRGIRTGYAPAIARTEEVLGSVGRMKYLRPLYRVLRQP